MSCPYCSIIFYVKVKRIMKPILAPLTPEQELRDKLADMTGEEYMRIANNFCPMCGEKIKEESNHAKQKKNK